MKEIILTLLIFLIYSNLIFAQKNILKSCPAMQFENCEMPSKCEFFNDLKKQYCKEIGDTNKYKEKYEKAAAAYNDFAKLFNENNIKDFVKRFQKEKLPPDYGVNVKTNKYEKKSPNSLYVTLGEKSDTGVLKGLFANENEQEIVNCYNLDEIIEKLKADSTTPISNIEEMYKIIWQHSCQHDLEKFKKTFENFNKLLNLLDEPLMTFSIKVGPNSDKLPTEEDLKKYDLEKMKQMIKSMHCKYDICTKPTPTSASELSPIELIGIYGGLALISLGGISYLTWNKLRSNVASIVESENLVAVSRIAAMESSFIDINEIFVKLRGGISYDKLFTLGKEIDLAELTIFDAKTISKLISLKDTLSVEEFIRYKKFIKEGRTAELEAKFADILKGTEEAGKAAQYARDFAKIIK